MAKKRLLEDFQSIESITSPSKAAKIDGVLTSLSPMKTGKKSYFEGRLTDETSSIRVVGFDALKQRELAAHHDQGNAVSLENCDIKHSTYSGQMEVMISHSTVILSSPKKLEHLIPTSSATDLITLDQLPSLQNYQKVSVKVKVLEVHDKLEVKPDLYKQDVVISDATDTARLTLWQTQIGTVHKSRCYDIKDVLIKTYNDVKYLTPPKSGCTIMSTEDIGAVQANADEEEAELKDAVVGLVLDVSKGNVWQKCKGKISTTSSHIGKCQKCSAVQRLDKCPKTMSAISYGNGQSRDLQAYLPMIKAITGNDGILDSSDVEEQLLLSDPFSLKYSPTNVIYAVNRQKD